MDEEKKTEIEETTTTSIPETEVTNQTKVEKKGFNITSLILGIVSLISFCVWYVSVPTGIIAIIFSVAGKKDAGRGMGVAGMVLGIIGLIFTAIYVIFIVGLAAALVDSGYYY